MSAETEREWEIHKELEKQQEDCVKLQKELANMEEEAYWKNQRIQAVNEELLTSGPKDERLLNMLLEKEAVSYTHLRAHET